LAACALAAAACACACASATDAGPPEAVAPVRFGLSFALRERRLRLFE